MNINWKPIRNYKDIKFEHGQDDAQGIIKITINRPEVRNSFRPKTVFELQDAFHIGVRFGKDDFFLYLLSI